MRDLGPGELAAMRDESVAAMQDVAKRLVYSLSTDAFNTPIPVYTLADNELDCAFLPLSASEVKRLALMDIYAEASVRMPLGTTLEKEDRLRISKRFGSPISVDDFDIVGEPMIRMSCLLVLLKRVQP